MLKPLHFTPLTTKEIKPTGWLLRQLQIQAAGLSGNLDKIWSDVRDSRWIGGEREGWERVPYWLDGFIPLAYLLDDEDMKARAKRYIDAIIDGQQEDGWICPCPPERRGRYDMWALFLICKVLVVYHDCTGDERIPDVIYRALAQYVKHMHYQLPFNWGAARWYEALISIFWLYERRQEDWLLDLAHNLSVSGVDYKRMFANWRDQKARNNWSFLTHVVNLSMALKSEALMSRMTERTRNARPNEEDFAKHMISLLDEYHGMACGQFTGDECLSGNSPIQGTETCGVAESMFSYENLLSITGDAYWGDRLEQLAFNAFPAANSVDMWTHQYDQMTNQICCAPLPEGKNIFRTNDNRAHMFGLEPHYGCCTANFNQAWPKFALSTFMRSEKGIVSAALAPASVELDIDGVAIKCELVTDYPFRDKLTYKITAERAVTFDLSIRIPRSAKSALVNGEAAAAGTFHTISREWNGETTVNVQLEFECVLMPRPNDMFHLQRGPLLYSLAIDEKWVMHEYTKNDVERKFPYCDYSVLPQSKWNYAFASKDFVVTENPDWDAPFSTTNSPISITASMVEIDWGTKVDNDDGTPAVCAEVPKNRTPISEPVTKKFIPYGCTNLRMTEMPIILL